MKKTLVTGFIVTVTPLHVSSPSSARFDPSTGERAFGDRGVPLAAVQTLGIPAMITPRQNGEGEQRQAYPGVRQIPAVNGNNWSGRTRRCTADVFLEALRDKGELVNINTYSAIKTGAATGSPDGSPITYDEYVRATNHPFLGLFGGGPRMIKRKARTFPLIALCDESRALLMRNRVPYDMLYDGWEQILIAYMPSNPARNLTMIWTYRRNDDLRDLVGISTAADTIENFEAAFAERQAAVIEDFRRGREKGEGGKTTVFTFQAMEFILPGVAFPFIAVLDDVTDAQAGLWFRGLERFCQNETIGGWSRNGFGVFSFENGRVSVLDNGELVETHAYSPSNAADPSAEDSYRTRTVSAWLDAAETITAEEINQLMRLPDKAG